MADLIPSIREMLRDGFGCEDIAVQLGVPVEGVRRLMRGWQKTGVIKAVLRCACEPEPTNEALNRQKKSPAAFDRSGADRQP